MKHSKKMLFLAFFMTLANGVSNARTCTCAEGTKTYTFYTKDDSGNYNCANPGTKEGFVVDTRPQTNGGYLVSRHGVLTSEIVKICRF